MHYYKRNIGDYAKKCGRLTMLQHGAYTLLIDACYDREVFPTLRDAIDWTWASNKEEVEAVEFVLNRFFALENGVYMQKRIIDELDQYHLNAETNKRIAIERESNRASKRTNRAPVVNEAPRVDNEPPPNQEPLTINHNKEPKGSSPASRTPSQQLIEVFHEKCKYLPRMTIFNDNRRKTLQARFKEVMISEKWDSDQTIEWFETFYGIVNESKFLTGRAQPGQGGRIFKADWDWIHGPQNFAKIVEGKYSGE